MKYKSTKLTKSIAILEGITSIVGIVSVFLVFSKIDFGIKENVIFLLLQLLCGPYIVAAYWLWKGKRIGLVLSFILTGLAVIDIQTETFMFYLTNGLYLNLDYGMIQIDIWSSLILIGLILVSILGFRVEPVAGGDRTR